jgi:hypothetical protein
VYALQPDAGVGPAPHARLVGFEVAELRPDEARSIVVELAHDAFLACDDAGERVALRGRWRVVAGGCCPGPRGLELGAPPHAEVTLQLE